MRSSASTTLLLLAVAALSACDDDTPAGTAELRIIHAAPDAPAVDVYVASVAKLLVADVTYGEASDYLPLAPGSYAIEIRPAGAPADSAPVHRSENIVLAQGDRVTAIAVGFLESTSEADRFRVLALAEAFEPAVSDTARVRIVHAAPDAPAVGIDVGNDGTAEIASLARFADSGAAGVSLPAGMPIAIGILAGDPPTRVTAFTTPALTAGSELFVIATGSLAARPRAPDGFGLLAVADTGLVGLVRQDPVVFALHASPDAPRVDLFVGTTELADDLDLGDLSAPIQVQPGTYTIDFFAHEQGSTRPVGDPAASLQTPDLVAGERYLAIAAGFLQPDAGEPGFQLLAVADEFVAGDSPRARFVHASPDTPAIDVGTVSGGMFTPIQGWTDLAFGETTDGAGTQIPEGDSIIGARVTGSPSLALTFPLTTTPGLDAFVVALGSLTAGSLQLGVIDTNAFPWIGTLVVPVAD